MAGEILFIAYDLLYPNPFPFFGVKTCNKIIKYAKRKNKFKNLPKKDAIFHFAYINEKIFTVYAINIFSKTFLLSNLKVEKHTALDLSILS